jgi:hypothetical protein
MIVMLLADATSGKWRGSAQSLKTLLNFKSACIPTRALDSLEAKGFILRDYTPRQWGNYPIVVDEYVITLGPDKGKRVDLSATAKKFGLTPKIFEMPERKYHLPEIADACANPVLVEAEEGSNPVARKAPEFIRKNSPSKSKSAPASTPMGLALALQEYAGVPFDLNAAAKTLTPIAEVLSVEDMIGWANIALAYDGYDSKLHSVAAPQVIEATLKFHRGVWESWYEAINREGQTQFSPSTTEETKLCAKLYQKLAGPAYSVTTGWEEKDGQQVLTVYIDLLDKSQCVPTVPIEQTGVEAAA